MTDIARRDLLVTSGLALTGTLSLPGTTVAAPTDGVAAAREQLLFDFRWKFRLGHGSDPTRDLGFGFGQSDYGKTGEFGFAKVGFQDADWRTLDLPHDWAVEVPFVHDAPATATPRCARTATSRSAGASRTRAWAGIERPLSSRNRTWVAGSASSSTGCSAIRGSG